jgi:L-ascorbate metabolism protein UlaG (beta-lactamase superfamily)
MWKRRAKRAAYGVSFLLVAGVVILILLWQDRPSLDNIEWQNAPPPGDKSLRATWLGVSTVLFDDGETQILIDGFFSRPSLAEGLLRRPVQSHAATINFALHEYDMRRLAAIIPVHSHFDHVMDVGEIAKRSTASVLGSESTANIARGSGVPEDQITVVASGETSEFGEFKVRLLESRHAPIGWGGTVPLDGKIEEPLSPPQPLQAMRVGTAWSVVIEHPQGTTLVQGSAGFIEGALDEISVDLALICSNGLTLLGKEYAENYWRSVVTSTGASVVIPMHFDDFTRPFGEIVPFPRFIDDIETAADWFESFRDMWDIDTRLYLPQFGKPMAVYSQPDSTI